MEPLSLRGWRITPCSFSSNPDLQRKREKSGDVETAGREKIPFFQLQKMCLLHISCPNNEVKTSLYRRYGQP
ncbi:hypothetical protein HanPSC8_Chr11g0467151 [Helianthus annuus]|nr:hypothetical protein HanPSC8_Chr11g0467151 [Helianthus annuus]